METKQAPGAGFARLLELSGGAVSAPALHAVAELGIADLMADGPRSVDDVAAATSTHPRALFRLLRMFAAQGIFTQVEPGVFGLTPTGQHLRKNHPMSVSAFLLNMKMLAPVFQDVMYSLRTGATAFERVYGEPLFAYLEHNPEKAKIFTAAMSGLTHLECAAVIRAYDFSGIHRMIDVGGGDGTFMTFLLRAVPGATGVVFDAPHVAATARDRIRSAGLTERCDVVEGDFFAEVPAGGDLYVLKSIIHDWSRDAALKILGICRKAMPATGRLLLVERVLPESDAPHIGKTMDFGMLVVLGGEERTAKEYGELLAEAGFRLSRVIDTESPLSIVEALPA